jgi:sulfofructose kinase
VPSILDGERSEARLLQMLVPLAAHCIFSETGMRIFAGGAGPAEGLRRAMAVGVGSVAAVTRGERSTLWIERGNDAIRETPSFPVQASNTSGAGDVFHGAYALAIAEGQQPEAALRFAAAAGACRARDSDTPRRATLEALLAGA